MAKASTNDRKRGEMKALIEAAFAQGWTANRIAAFCGHTASCVSSWKLGKSMGTNAQRAALATLPAVDSAEVQAKLAAVLRKAQADLATEEKDLAEVQSEEYIQKKIREEAKYVKDEIARLQGYLAEIKDGASGYFNAEHAPKFEAEIVERQAELADPAKMAARVRDRAPTWIPYHQAKVNGARQWLKTVQAAIASYKGQAQLSL